MEQLDRIEAALSELLNRVRGEVVTKADVEAAVAATSTQGAPPAAVTDFVSLMIGAHRMEPTPTRDDNIAAGDAAYQSEYHAGNVSLADLDVVDLAYLANMKVAYFAKTGADLRWSGVVGGTTAQINAAFSVGEAWRNNYPAADYTGPLKAIISAMMGE